MAHHETKYKCFVYEKKILQQILMDKFKELQRIAIQHGVSEDDFRQLCLSRTVDPQLRRKKHGLGQISMPSLALVCTAVVLGICGLGYSSLDKVTSEKCTIENNFFLMEMSRPIANCSICKDVENVLVLADNVTKDLFSQFAYTSRPFVVRGQTNTWTAFEVFTFDFFKSIYQNTKGALQSVEEECQFFPFRTEFLSLEDVFSMSKERAEMKDGEKPWYIGWSNCNPDVAAVLRQHYHRPHFLPEDSESSAIDWLFMGGTGTGASLHLDYVQRPSWQAQISGQKTWHLVPPPECEDICHAMDITIKPGDIFFLDTNQWYHNTFIHPGEISITIGSEYD